MSNPAVEIASTIQSASIKRHPSPAHDVNPSTSASTKKPVEPVSPTSVSSENSIPESALKPAPRRANLPPLPDLRFEQSYLASIKSAETWWAIAWITGRDHVPKRNAIHRVWKWADLDCRCFCRLFKGHCGRWRCRVGDTGIEVLSSREQVWEADYEDGGGASTIGISIRIMMWRQSVLKRQVPIESQTNTVETRLLTWSLVLCGAIRFWTGRLIPQCTIPASAIGVWGLFGAAKRMIKSMYVVLTG